MSHNYFSAPTPTSAPALAGNQFNSLMNFKCIEIVLLIIGISRFTVRVTFDPFTDSSQLHKISKLWTFDDRPTIVGLKDRANAYYGSLPLLPNSFKMYQDNVELVEDDDIFAVDPTELIVVHIIPSFYVLKFEVLNWISDENRKRLKTICTDLQVPAEIKRVSAEAVRVIIKHTNFEVLDECRRVIVTQVGSAGSVTAGETSEDFGTLAQGTLIHGSRGLVRIDGVDSEECSLTEKMSRWTGLS